MTSLSNYNFQAGPFAVYLEY